MPYVYVAVKVTHRQIMFMTKPTFIISTVFMPEGSNAMAFGGVDTGNMNANDVINVGGNIMVKGFTCVVQLSCAMMGSKMAAEATLEAT